MDESEARVERYLKTLFKSVVHEPDGNKTPDFLADGRVAVEVRRLNQNVFPSVGRAVGLEERQRPLWDGMRKLLASLGPPPREVSWFVSYKFRRPLASWSVLEAEIRRKLLIHSDQSDASSAHYHISENFDIDLIRADQAQSQLFELGACLDYDSGGFVVFEIHRNVQICSDQKAAKVDPVRSRYPEWWLVLVDHIGFGLQDFSNAIIEKKIAISHRWDRLVVLSLDSNQPAIVIGSSDR